MIQGTIMKGVGGFYYVKAQDRLYECKARGIFKKDGITPAVGDEVELSDLSEDKAVIHKILERKNHFLRPTVANIEQMVLVISMASPEPNLSVLDRFLVMAEREQVEIVICLTKGDLDDPVQLERYRAIYEPSYPVVLVNGLTGEGIMNLKPLLAGKKSAFAGPSGVGKSTLLNLIHETLELETGSISRKTNRGKHTTRHVELFEVSDGGMLFDTPGFTSFDILEAEEDELQYLFPEIEALIGKCKYKSCRHSNEPGCAVKDAVAAGKIPKSRYESYLSMYQEILTRNPY